MAILKDKYAIIIGDRDGVPGPAIEECAKTAGAKIAYSSQSALSERPQVPWIWKPEEGLNISEEHGPENVVVLLGAAEAEAAGLAAETVTAGDPTYAGPLAGVQLGLSVYHICEDEVKAETDPAVYEEQVGMMEMVMDVPAIHEEMEDIRKEYCRY